MSQKKTLTSLDFQLFINDSQNSSKAPATLKSVSYQCLIINNIMKTSLTQTFISNSGNEYSVTNYYFPLQEGVCLESFQAKYNEKTIKGIIKEKCEAQQEYQENMEYGNLVFYAQTSTVNDKDYCKILLGNLPPNQQVEINLVFSSQLASLLNKYFVVEIPLQYCEDEISAKLGKNVLTLDLFCTGKINYAESRGIQVEKQQVDENQIRFNLSQSKLQKDFTFQLVFAFDGMFDPQVIYGQSKIFNLDSVKSAILPVSNSVMVSFIPNFNEHKAKEIDGAIQAAIVKGEDVFGEELQQKLNTEVVDHLSSSKSEFIFLLDRSLSMSGSPIIKACEALILFLKSLPTDSYFNVVSFGSSYSNLFESSLKYNSQNLEKAIKSINEYAANLGGTEIYKPLKGVFEQKRISGYNKQIFLLTDGEVSSPKEVVGMIKKNNKFNRVHSIGFGSQADKYLINESAKAGKGISKIVELNCDLQEVIIEMLSHSISPTFDEFKIVYDQDVFDSTYPSLIDFPCVFKDEIINIHLFFKSLKDITNLTETQKEIQIEYYDTFKKEKVQKQIKLEIPDSFTCNPELQQSVFKIGKQLFLKENLANEKSDNSLVQQAIDFQLLTEKTALICLIETLNDEQKIQYESIKNHNVFYSNEDKEEIQKIDYFNNNMIISRCLLSDQSEQINDLLISSNKPVQNKQKSTTFFDKILNVFCLKNFSSPPSTPKKSRPIQYQIYNQKFPSTSNLSMRQDDIQCSLPQMQKCIITQVDNLEEECKQSGDSKGTLNLNQKVCNQREFNHGLDNKVPRRESVKELQNPSVPKLENLLNLVNSEGEWQFDENLIKQCNNINISQINHYYSKFASKNGFMTLFISIIIETYYAEQRSKLMLISKKSNNFIKTQLNKEEDLNVIKDSLKQLITQ